MKQLMSVVIAAIILFSCKSKPVNNNFTITGEIKNIPDQNVYLEELFFSQRNPEVLDTAAIKNGKFEFKVTASEQGLYRLRLEDEKAVFVLINDSKHLQLSADFSNLNMKSVTINSLANSLLKNFIIQTDEQLSYLQSKGNLLQQFPKVDKSDSVYNAMRQDYDEKSIAHKKYLIQYIDTCSNPIMTIFALGYTRDIEPEKLEKTISNLGIRFPKNQTINSVVAQYKQVMIQSKQEEMAAKNPMPQIGDMAPEISMPDTSGKMFSLSQLKGKYVLVDFWASWCGPCRAENPNVVVAYRKYSSKNFTVLGVSLDKNKASWIEAIKTDHLTWTHISDLKHWASAAVPLYGFTGIPYNVLIDPQGKIIASSLRGADLEDKLAEVLK